MDDPTNSECNEDPVGSPAATAAANDAVASMAEALRGDTQPSSLAGEQLGVGSKQLARRWLSMEYNEAGQQLTVDPSLNLELAKLGDAPLNLMMIFGPARKGKSFLMNLLVDPTGADNVFPVSAAAAACTTGVDMSPRVFPHAAVFPDVAAGSSEGIRVGFCDAEGQGDKAPEYDVQMVSPLLLLARVVLFNWLGRPEKATMLDRLACLATAAERIDPEGSRHAAGTPRFGHLHVLMRDFPDARDVRAILFDDEPIPPASGPRPDLERNNRIRKLLAASFESISIWGLPRPVESSAVLDAGDFGGADVQPAFRAKVHELRAVLGEQLATPHHLEGHPISGRSAAALADLLTSAVNRNATSLSPASAFATMQQQQLAQAVVQTVTSHDAVLRELEAVVRARPLPADELEVLLARQEAECAGHLTTQCAGLPGLDGACVELSHKLTAHAARVRAANEQAALLTHGAQQAAEHALARDVTDRVLALESGAAGLETAEMSEVLANMLATAADTYTAALHEAGLALPADAEGEGSFLPHTLLLQLERARTQLGAANENAHRRARGEVIVPAVLRLEQFDFQVVPAAAVLRRQKFEGDGKTCYDLAITLLPADPTKAATFREDMLHSAGFQQRRWRKWVHFSWLDYYIRASRMAGVYRQAQSEGLQLPKGPGTFTAPSTWLAWSRSVDSEDRQEQLLAYLCGMLQHPQLRDSLLLKIFLAPDEVFRPLRAAVKGSTYALQSVEDVIDRSARNHHHLARFLEEAGAFPSLREWLQLQMEREYAAALRHDLAAAATERSFTSEVTNRPESIHAMLTWATAALETQRERISSLQALLADAEARVDFARGLTSMQRESEQVLFLPNVARDHEAQASAEALEELRGAHQHDMGEYESAVNFQAACRREIETEQNVLKRQTGQTSKAAKMMQWLMFQETWELTPERCTQLSHNACEELKAFVDTKARLSQELIHSNELARGALTALNAEAVELHTLRPLLGVLHDDGTSQPEHHELGAEPPHSPLCLPVALDAEASLLEQLGAALKTESELRVEEAQARTRKLDAVEEDLAAREALVASLEDAHKHRVARREERAAAHAEAKREHPLRMRDARDRQKLRRSRIEKRIMRCELEERRLAQQQAEEAKILHFQRAKEAASREADAAAIAVEELSQKHTWVVKRIESMEAAVSQLRAEDEAQCTDGRARLAEGNPRVKEEGGGTGAAAPVLSSTPAAAGEAAAAHAGEADPDMASCARRRAAVDTEISRLSDELCQEENRAPSEVQAAEQTLSLLREVRESHEVEMVSAAEEKALVEREAAALRGDAALLRTKEAMLNKLLEERIATEQDMLDAADLLHQEVQSRDAALAHRCDQADSRENARKGWAADADRRRTRSEARSRSAAGWIERLGRSRGLGFVAPEQDSHESDASSDARASAKVQGGVQQQRRQLREAQQHGSAARKAVEAAQAAARERLAALRAARLEKRLEKAFSAEDERFRPERTGAPEEKAFWDGVAERRAVALRLQGAQETSLAKLTDSLLSRQTGELEKEAKRQGPDGELAAIDGLAAVFEAEERARDDERAVRARVATMLDERVAQLREEVHRADRQLDALAQGCIGLREDSVRRQAEWRRRGDELPSVAQARSTGGTAVSKARYFNSIASEMRSIGSRASSLGSAPTQSAARSLKSSFEHEKYGGRSFSTATLSRYQSLGRRASQLAAAASDARSAGREVQGLEQELHALCDQTGSWFARWNGEDVVSSVLRSQRRDLTSKGQGVDVTTREVRKLLSDEEATLNRLVRDLREREAPFSDTLEKLADERRAYESMMGLQNDVARLVAGAVQRAEEAEQKRKAEIRRREEEERRRREEQRRKNEEERRRQERIRQQQLQHQRQQQQRQQEQRAYNARMADQNALADGIARGVACPSCEGDFQAVPTHFYLNNGHGNNICDRCYQPVRAFDRNTKWLRCRKCDIDICPNCERNCCF